MRNDGKNSSIEQVKDHAGEIVEATTKLLEIISGKLYRFPLRILAELNPTLEELAEIVELVATKAAHADPKLAFISEAAKVLYEASAAVGDKCEQTVTDCAYHLEEIVDRVRRYVP